MSNNTTHIKGQWEWEMNTIVEDDPWVNVCSRCHRLYLKANIWKEFDCKVKMRLFRTLLTTCTFENNSTIQCARNGGMVSDLTHIF